MDYETIRLAAGDSFQKIERDEVHKTTIVYDDEKNRFLVVPDPYVPTYVRQEWVQKVVEIERQKR